MKQQTESRCTNKEGICTLDEWMRELTWREKLTIQFRRVGYSLQSLFLGFRWRCQRFMRGYAWPDAWEIDTWFMRTAKPLLQTLLEHHSSHPGDMTNEEWESVLQEMIRCLELMNYKNAEAHLGRSATGNKPSYHAVVDCIMEHKHRFFVLFDDYFFALWD